MTSTSNSVLRQIADLQNLTHEELRELWRTLICGEPPAYNRTFIISRLTYRIQELAYGGLSDRARRTMREVLEENGFNENACDGGTRRRQRDRKRKEGMPVLGTRFVREWNGGRYEVTVVNGGFEFEGRRYRSLTAIAKAITGTHWNGRAFFGLRSSKAEQGGQDSRS